MTKQSRDHYDEARRERDVQRRRRAHEFPNLIERAAAGDTGPLREYLQSSDPLSEDHRSLLAGLIYRRIERKGRGKRGEALRAHGDAVHRVAFEIRKLQGARGLRTSRKIAWGNYAMK